jgi:hypothetical protein
MSLEIEPFFPCIDVEALHPWVGNGVSKGRRGHEGNECVCWRMSALCKWLRMKFSAGCLQCRPAEASRCYELCPETHDVLSETFEQRDALSFQNEYSDDL